MKNIIGLISSCFIVVASGSSVAYPMEDTDFLVSAYCFYMAQAPLLSVDLSSSEKEIGRNEFFNDLVGRGLDFPVGRDYEYIQYKFAAWVVPRFEGVGAKGALDWYRENCTDLRERGIRVCPRLILGIA